MHRCYCGESACVSACTCRCDSGGDCECLCTAVAAFASECDRHGVYVKWRNQHFCRTSCSFWARPVCYQTVFCLSILSRPSVLSVTFVYCGQTVGWIQMKLGMQVGLVPDHIVLDEDPAPLLQKGGRVPPIFGPCLLWPNGWVDQDDTWQVGPQSRPHCARWEPAPPPQKGGRAPNFRPISIVTKRLDGSRCHLVRR